jgi:hypothetical protein
MAIFQNDDGVLDKKAKFYGQRPVGLQEAMGLNVFSGNNPVETDVVDDNTGMDISGAQSESEPITSLAQAYDAYKNMPENKPPATENMFSYKIRVGEEPVRDAAQAQRLQKMAKFNLISQGLQTVFGAVLGAKGEIVPAPFDSPLNQQLGQAMQQMDNQYYQDLSKHRDQQFRSQLINMDQANNADRARLDDMRWQIDRLMQDGRYEEAQAAKTKQQEFENDLATRTQSFREGKAAKDYNLESNRQYNYGRSNMLQTVGAMDDAIRREQESLKMMQSNFAPDEEVKAQSDRILKLSTERDQMIKQLSGREGFDIDQSTPQDQPTGKPLSGKDLSAKVNSGELTVDQAREQMMSQFSARYKKDHPDASDQDIFNAANNDVDNAMVKMGLKDAPPPKEEDFNDPTEFAIEKKAHDQKMESTKEERAVESTMNEKKGILKNELTKAVDYLDPDRAREINDNFRSQPENAINDLLKELKKGMPKEEYKGIPSMVPKINSNKEVLIKDLEAALADYKLQKQTHGIR